MVGVGFLPWLVPFGIGSSEKIQWLNVTKFSQSPFEDLARQAATRLPFIPIRQNHGYGEHSQNCPS
jgi:hypothetical protein